MSGSILLDFLADPLGGSLTSGRAFLNRARTFDPVTRMVVLEDGDAVSRGVMRPTDFEWVRAGGSFGWPRVLRRTAWQNLMLPGVVARYGVRVYLSLSHYLPATLPRSVRTVVGVSNLAPFSEDALAAERGIWPRLRLRTLRHTVISTARRADRVVALSKAGRDVLVERGIEATKISIVPNGVETAAPAGERDQEILDRLGVGGGFVLCVSHFYRYKNYGRLVNAYARLSGLTRETYPLLLVGVPHDSAYFSEIRRQAAELGIAGQIRLVPGLFGEDLRALYRHCTLFVFPSLIENSPVTLLEALSHGAPVAASDIAAMRELGDAAAVYFDPHSDDEICRVMAELLADADKRARLRADGPRQAGRHTWDAFTASLVNLYQELAA